MKVLSYLKDYNLTEDQIKDIVNTYDNRLLKNLDFSKVGRFHLDAMLKDGAITSISSFMTNLIRVVQTDNSLTGISVKGITKCATKNIVEEILDKIPSHISKFLKRGRHYLCHNYKRKR